VAGHMTHVLIQVPSTFFLFSFSSFLHTASPKHFFSLVMSAASMTFARATRFARLWAATKAKAQNGYSELSSPPPLISP